MSIIGQAVSAGQVRDGHQGGVDSGNVNPLYVEQYGGEVETRILKESFMRQFFNFKSVRGTDTVTNDRMGFTALQKVTRGVRPTDSSPTFDNISVKVDTIVLARTNQFLLDDFLAHLDVRKEVGVEHGKTIGKFFDEAFIVQGIKAAQITNQDPTGAKLGGWLGGVGGYTEIIRTAPEGFQGATPIMLTLAGDELDSDKLVRAIQDMCQSISEKDVEISEGVVLVRPAEYYTLLRNDKLLDRDFSEMNGDFAKGQVLQANGVRIQTTNRFPVTGDVGATHYLSNAGNGNAYDVTANDVKCIALFLQPKALLAGETIPLTSKVYYSDIELQWFIDSYLAFGVTPNRAEMAAGIFLTTA
tara:strand:+ start:3701 stop:4771 length:1071 start_codon:yes stop_codon:yes gene_type:complete